MIDEYSLDRTGWARFSDDRTKRYRLARSLNDIPISAEDVRLGVLSRPRVTFLMLNPSTADAFVLDPTVRRCVGFARAWGAEVLEVVNIFALRSTDPQALYTPGIDLGDDHLCEGEILGATGRAMRVIAGWGKHGALNRRGEQLREKLERRGVELYHLGLNGDGSPKHPLYLKATTEPTRWT